VLGSRCETEYGLGMGVGVGVGVGVGGGSDIPRTIATSRNVASP
jgi:hypothetical protein